MRSRSSGRCGGSRSTTPPSRARTAGPPGATKPWPARSPTARPRTASPEDTATDDGARPTRAREKGLRQTSCGDKTQAGPRGGSQGPQRYPARARRGPRLRGFAAAPRAGPVVLRAGRARGRCVPTVRAGRWWPGPTTSRSCCSTMSPGRCCRWAGARTAGAAGSARQDGRTSQLSAAPDRPGTAVLPTRCGCVSGRAPCG